MQRTGTRIRNPDWVRISSMPSILRFVRQLSGRGPRRRCGTGTEIRRFAACGYRYSRTACCTARPRPHSLSWHTHTSDADPVTGTPGSLTDLTVLQHQVYDGVCADKSGDPRQQLPDLSAQTRPEGRGRCGGTGAAGQGADPASTGDANVGGHPARLRTPSSPAPRRAPCRAGSTTSPSASTGAAPR